MSQEIPMYPVSTQPPAAGEVIIDDAMVTLPPPVNAKPVHVLISPIVPVPADGASATEATSLPPPLAAYTGVLYLDHHKWAAVGRDDDSNKKRETWLQEMRGWLMLLATLAASVTYQAGLNPPGGFWQADDDQGHVAGTPVLESKFSKRNILLIAQLLSKIHDVHCFADSENFCLNKLLHLCA